jgi:hypothetical protein
MIFIETNVTISKHLDFWLSVNLFARGGVYDTFPEIAIIEHQFAKTRQKRLLEINIYMHK